jgi:hypothetical protein
MAALGLITSLGGCGFSSPPAQNDATPGNDACTSFASQVDTCKLAFGEDLTLAGSVITYNTGTHVLQVDGTTTFVPHMTLTTKAGDVDAIVARNVRLSAGAGLRAIGMLPFAIVASGSVTLEDRASIDVGDGGAGALSGCSNPPKAGGAETGGAGGGGGGGYGAAGGDGGEGNDDGTHAPGGAKSNAIGMPPGPRGGCPGAPGGMGDRLGGVGGPGGGALYIAAAVRIEIVGNSGALMAGGGGGHGGTQSRTPDRGDAGGGGGGSGGMIFLESPHVLGPHGQVAANGGGGGGGSSDMTPGTDGAAGASSRSRAAGGMGGAPDAADGGRGGSLQGDTGETPGRLKAGGGGGGGGVGYIHIESADVQLESISPDRQ